MKLFLHLLCAVLLTSFASAKEGWMDNFEQAKAKAQAENKKMVLDFTGSDWCPWCLKLEKEVFSQAKWKKYAAQNLILVEVDFPQHRALSRATQKQNEALQGKYHVESFPTIVVLNAKGARQGDLGYVAGGPDAFIKALEKVKR